jgi:hypothetical protein
MKKSNIVPIIKQGKEDIRDPSKYRSVSLLNVARKVLDKLMIDRILHHVHSNAGLNSNQCGFIPQSRTVEAAMAVKEIIGENLKQKNCISVVSFDVRKTFDAVWWPSILRNLKKTKVPEEPF